MRAVALAAPTLLLLFVTGCGGGGGWRSAGFVVRSRALPVSSPDARACLGLFPPIGTPAGPGTELLGRVGRSVTFRVGTRLVGCDGVAGQRRWCSSSLGPRRDGRLADPRLSLGCRVRGKPLAFGWVEPVPGARWVVVRGPGTPELYPVTRLPVRVTTTRVGLDSASFDVAQYTAGWRELERRRLVMRVAG